MTELAMDYQQPFDNAFTRPAAKTFMQVIKKPDYNISTKKYPLNSHPEGCKVDIISLNFVDKIKLGKWNVYTQKTDQIRVYIGETARYAGMTLHAHVVNNGICTNEILSEDQKPNAHKAMVHAAFYEAFYTPEWLEKYPAREKSYTKLHADIDRIKEVFCNNFSVEEAEEIEQHMANKVAKVGKALNC